MKITLLSENLKEGIDIVARILTKKLTLPILDSFLIATEKNFIKICSTNLESGVFWWGLAKIEKEGKICIARKILTSLIDVLPTGSVELEEKDLILNVKSEKFFTKIKGINPDDFPVIPQPKLEEFVFFEAEDLVKTLKKVLPLPSPSLATPEISGILFSISQDGLKMAATDRFRLAEVKIDQKFDISKSYSIILPQGGAKEIYNILSRKTGKIKIYLSPNQIFFEKKMESLDHPEFQFTCRLIEGEFPDYQSIIPKDFGTIATLSTDEFLKKIKSAGIFATKANEIELSFLPKQKKVEILSQNPDIGEFKSEILAQIEGKEIKISFNYKFLIDGILSIEEPFFKFFLTHEEGPAMIKPEKTQDYFYLLMPIKKS